MKKFLYRVKAGDTVLSLSNDFCVPTSDIIRENNLVAEIKAGDLLILSPQEDAYKVKPFEKEEGFPDSGFPYLFYGLVLKP